MIDDLSALCDELERFQTNNRLPQQCALEQAYELGADDARLPWLMSFNARWDAACEAEALNG